MGDLPSLRVRLGAVDETERHAALQELYDLDLTRPSTLAALLQTVEGLPLSWNKEINRRVAKALIDTSQRPEILAVLVDKLGVGGTMTLLHHADGYDPMVPDEDITGPG